MGLIPRTLKDTAWPKRRIVHITKPLPWFCEVLVLALGLVPSREEDSTVLSTRQRSEESNGLAKRAWRLRRSTFKNVIAVLTVTMVACYTGLVFNKVYSKRSALGCVAPLFIAAWYVVSLLPSVIHSFFASRRRARVDKTKRSNARRNGPYDGQSILLQQHGPATLSIAAQHGTLVGTTRSATIISAIQGADEEWPVQMDWDIYYIAGTLVFTSIMAVTVIDLVDWVALCFALTGCSEVLAFFICLSFESTGRTIPMAAEY
jgi:hypothetical protein